MSVQPIYGLPGASPVCYTEALRALPNMVGWWRLNEKSGTTAADQMGVRTLTVTSGTVTFGQPGPLQGGGSFLFGGGYLSGSAPGGYAKATVMAWISTIDTSVDVRPCIYYDRGAGSGISFHMGKGIVGGGVNFNLFGEQNGNSKAYGRGSVGRPVNDGQWHHVALVVDGTSGAAPAVTDFHIYIDGLEVGSYSNDAYSGYNWPTNPAVTYIGHGPNPWYGYIADVSLHMGALPASTILRLATSPRR